jgi:GDP-L-fucose synthase
MRILVTGGAGFLGQPVVRQLEERGHEVFVARSRDYDLRRVADIHRLLGYSQPEVVVHLAAAVGGIGANEAEPGRFFYDNIMMGTQLMHAAWQAGVRKFVTIGTVCEYPENAELPFREDQLWDGYPAPVTAPYALAKKALLVQAQAYRAQYGFDSIHLIPVNLYGPGDNFDLKTGHVLPALVRKFAEAATLDLPTVEVWGSGTATREFIYVDDAARGIVLATENYSGASPVNIGTGVETSIRDLAEGIVLLTGFHGEIVWDATRPDGTPRRQLDVSLAAREFGFSAEVSLTEGLRRTINWWWENQ